MVQIRQIMDWLDSWAPFRYAQSWDNSGLQVGSPGAFTERVLIALDPGSEVVDEAVRLGCGCLVTHHPLLFRPIAALRTDVWPGSVIARAVLSGVNIIAVHTNLDAARGGTNAQLQAMLGLENIEPLEAEPAFCEEAGYLGIGLTGTLPVKLPVGSLAVQLSRGLGCIDIRMTGDPDKPVSRAAICTGSGASLIGKVLESGSEVFITGDIKYHDAKLAEESGLALIDVGHYASEKLILKPIAERLESKARSEGAVLDIFIAKSEKDPFSVIVGKC